MLVSEEKLDRMFYSIAGAKLLKVIHQKQIEIDQTPEKGTLAFTIRLTKPYLEIEQQVIDNMTDGQVSEYGSPSEIAGSLSSMLDDAVKRFMKKAAIQDHVFSWSIKDAVFDCVIGTLINKKYSWVRDAKWEMSSKHIKVTFDGEYIILSDKKHLDDVMQVRIYKTDSGDYLVNTFRAEYPFKAADSDNVMENLNELRFVSDATRATANYIQSLQARERSGKTDTKCEETKEEKEAQFNQIMSICNRYNEIHKE